MANEPSRDDAPQYAFADIAHYQSPAIETHSHSEHDEGVPDLQLPPSLQQNSEICPEDEWEWLSYIDNDECYMPYQDKLAAKTSDFGAEGYTASLTNWHELLQLTAPDPICGLIYVRGDFPGTSESIIARAQNRDDAGGKGTFGIQVLGYQLVVYTRGLINYRWPHIQYILATKDGNNHGVFEMCSFVHMKSVYQIAHVHLWEDRKAETQNTPSEADTKSQTRLFHFRVGGKLTFGCMCTSVARTPSKFSYTIQQMDDGKSVSCHAANEACHAQTLCHCQLEMKVFVNGVQRQIKVIPVSAASAHKNLDARPSTPTIDITLDDNVDFSDVIDIATQPGESFVMMLVFGFVSGTVPGFPLNAPSSDSVKAILGVNDESNNCISRIWSNWRIKDHDQIDADDINSIARCVEYICSVVAIPIMADHGNLLLKTDDPPINDTASDSAAGSTRRTIHDGAGSPVEIIPPTQNVEAPEDSESLHMLTHNLSQQNVSGKIASLPSSTLRPSEDGEVSPSYIALPTSERSSVGVNDLTDVIYQHSPMDKIEIEEKNGVDELRSFALVRNIMYSQYVDLENTFWVLRFLIRADQFLQRHFANLNSEKSLVIKSQERESDEILMATYETYKAMLQCIIKGVLIWTARLSWDPISDTTVWNFGDLCSNIRTVSHTRNQYFELYYDSSEDGPCELTSSSWKPRWQTSYFAILTIFYILKHYKEMAKELVPIHGLWSGLLKFPTGRVSRDLKLKPALLQWLHSTCLLEIHKMFNKIPAESSRDAYTSYIKNLEHICSKLAKPPQKPELDLYTEEEEETDRLILICREFNSDMVFANTSFTYVSDKIQQRVATRTINIGNSVAKRLAPIVAPWELSCLNHHIGLKIAVDSSSNDDVKQAAVKEPDIKSIKEACFDFQSSDSMFLPTWDRSRRRMLEHWWNIDVSSILCATILELCNCSRDKESSTNTRNQNDANPTSSVPRTDSHQLDWFWTPTTTVFGDEWVESLEDTPDRFRNSQTRTISLRRSLGQYLQYCKDYSGAPYETPPSYSRENISELIPAADLLYLSLFDFGLDWHERDWSYGRDDLKRYQNDVEGPLWEWIRDGHPWQSLADPERLAKELIARIQEPNLRQNLFKDHQSKLLGRLSDSLVDQRVKYRIMLVERCSPSVVQAFVYMWHPRAIDTFDSYFSSLCNYADSREDDSWTTTITLVHWAFEPPTYKLDAKYTSSRSRYSENRMRGEYPPQNVRMLLRIPHAKDEKVNRTIQGYIEERSSIIVMTGDAKGYLWKCSIWSSLLHAQDVPLQSIRNISRIFRHQQSTGRNLIFLALLGSLCEKLHAELEHGLGRVKNYVELGQNVLLEGYDWDADDAVDKLRSMLWGLEALKMFDARLTPSLDKIENARKDLVLKMDREPGKRHSELDQAYRLELENFEKRHGLLLDIHQKISLKIAQVTSLRDGLSAVTNVQDSHIAIKQGNNIRMLTYITIAYLPLGFITALFSMGHGIVPDDAGSVLFVVLVVVFVFATYCLAFSLDNIFKLNNLFIKNWKSRHSEKSHGQSRFVTWIKRTKSSKTETPAGKEESDTVARSSIAEAAQKHGFSIFRRRRRVPESDFGSAEKGIVVDPTMDS